MTRPTLTIDSCMNSLLTQISTMISDGLTRQAIRLPSEWAERYRVMDLPPSGPVMFGFKKHPWARRLHDSQAAHIVGRKAAQMGFTEAAINRALFSIDIQHKSVLYVLPTVRPDAVDFSSARFDPALEMSPHLQSLFSDTKNVGLKRAGNCCLYVRSARSRSQLKSIPAADLIFDERDEMEEKMVRLAKERSSGQEEKSLFEISTPTIPGWGIDAVFQNSTQSQYFFKCPMCGRRTRLTQESLVITANDHLDPRIQESYYQCIECKKRLPHKSQYLTEANCLWVPSYSDRVIEGLHIPQFYSYSMSAPEMALAFLETELSDTNKQEYYNSKLGEPILIEGSQLTEEDLKACMNYDSFYMLNHVSQDRHITMGVDVGTHLNIEIDDWSIDPTAQYGSLDVNLKARPTLVHTCKVKDFEDLDGFMEQFNVNMCVIDKDPERRKAVEFRNRYPKRVWLCNYANKMSGNEILKRDVFVSVDRTSWMDLSLGRYRRGAIILPMDTPKEYLDNLQEPTRVYKNDQDGNPVGRYVNKGPDHYAHSRNYSEIAFALSMGLGKNESIEAN